MCNGCKYDSECESNGNEAIGGDEHLCPFFEPVEFTAEERLSALSTPLFPKSAKSEDIRQLAAPDILPEGIRYATQH